MNPSQALSEMGELVGKLRRYDGPTLNAHGAAADGRDDASTSLSAALITVTVVP